MVWETSEFWATVPGDLAALTTVVNKSELSNSPTNIKGTNELFFTMSPPFCFDGGE
jgi:hypothetical protein